MADRNVTAGGSSAGGLIRSLAGKLSLDTAGCWNPWFLWTLHGLYVTGSLHPLGMEEVYYLALPCLFVLTAPTASSPFAPEYEVNST